MPVACPEVRHVLVCLGARAACPQRVPRYGMCLFGSAGSLPAVCPEVWHALVCLGARAACPQRTPKHAMHRSSNVIMLSKQQGRRTPHLAGLAFPSTGHPAPIRALTFHGSLVATPARCSLINDVVCASLVRLF